MSSELGIMLFGISILYIIIYAINLFILYKIARKIDMEMIMKSLYAMDVKTGKKKSSFLFACSSYFYLF